jgi:hypothetical protein
VELVNLRSILEALALTVHGHAVTMAAELGAAYQQAIISGGGSNSDLLMQIFADVFGIPALRPAVTNAAGLGAAICAAIGVGVHPTFADAITAMVRPSALSTSPTRRTTICTTSSMSCARTSRRTRTRSTAPRIRCLADAALVGHVAAGTLRGLDASQRQDRCDGAVHWPTVSSSPPPSYRRLRAVGAGAPVRTD